MKKDLDAPTSQDYDRKHGQDHISHNPRAVKDIPGPKDSAPTENSGTAEIIARGHTITTESALQASFTEDKREAARHEHTNHFTNQASQKNQ